MKLTALYKSKTFPFVTCSIVLLCLAISVPTFFNPQLFDVFAMKTEPKYFWQYFTGIFEHGASPSWFLWVHMGMNFMGLIPCGILIEKMLGNKKVLYIFLMEWAVTSILFQIVRYGQDASSAGISSVQYAFTTVAFVFVYKVWKEEKRKIFKQPLFYYFIFEFLGMISLLNPVSMGWTSFCLHISGVFTGILCIIMLKVPSRSDIFIED